jgi:hypothetical protein
MRGRKPVLNDAQVCRLREEAHRGRSQVLLAHEYNISRGYCSSLVNCTKRQGAPGPRGAPPKDRVSAVMVKRILDAAAMRWFSTRRFAITVREVSEMLNIGKSRAAYALRLARACFARLDAYIKTPAAQRDSEHCWLWGGSCLRNGTGHELPRLVLSGKSERPKQVAINVRRLVTIMYSGKEPRPRKRLVLSCGCAHCLSPWHLGAFSEESNA